MSLSRPLFITALLIPGFHFFQAAPITQGVPGAVPVDEFRVMTKSEIAAHTQKMQSLSGTSREDYRNSEYQKLKQRALAQGFKLPDIPPWGRTKVVPSVVAPQAAGIQNDASPVTDAGPVTKENSTLAIEGSTPKTENGTAATVPPQKTAGKEAPPVDMAAMIQQQKDVVEQAIREHQVTLQKQQNTETEAIAGAPEEARFNDRGKSEAPRDAVAKTLADYRQAMRERFDKFMAEREARQAEVEKMKKESTEQFEQQRVQQQVSQQRLQQRFPRPQYQYPRPPQAQRRAPRLPRQATQLPRQAPQLQRWVPATPAYPARVYPQPQQRYWPYPPGPQAPTR